MSTNDECIYFPSFFCVYVNTPQRVMAQSLFRRVVRSSLPGILWLGPVITLGRRKKRTAGKGRRHVRQYLRGSREGRVPRQLSGFYAFFAPPPDGWSFGAQKESLKIVSLMPEQMLFLAGVIYYYWA